MNSRERVLRTLAFKNPDRIPVDLWILPAARMEYGERLDQPVRTSSVPARDRKLVL